MNLDEARALDAEQWTALRTSIEEYLATKEVLGNLEHDEKCDDPLCENKEFRAQWGPQSLSTFVLCAEFTTIGVEDPTATRTTRASYGSPMAVIGLLYEQLAELC